MFCLDMDWRLLCSDFGQQRWCTSGLLTQHGQERYGVLNGQDRRDTGHEQEDGVLNMGKYDDVLTGRGK